VIVLKMGSRVSRKWHNTLNIKQQHYARCEAPFVSLSNYNEESIMSILSLNLRPLMVFSASNDEHRKHYAEFIKRKTWGYCPVRFVIEGTSQTDLVTYIERCLVDFYTMKEFKVKNTLR
jgi:hypothetical protein